MNSALVKKASNRRKSSRSSRSRKRTKNSQSISFVRKFKKEGKQGLAGICKAKVDGEQKTMVYKTSRYLNYTSLHEYYVMRSLKAITPYCPYFCEVHDIIQVPMSPNFRDQKNPFKTDPNKYTIQGDVLLMNYVKGKNLYSLVKRREIDDRIIFSAMRQVIGAIMIAQDELNFSHYDLHSSNIIMTPCEPNSISLFISGEKLISSPTYGAQPVVIDFGFSYSDELKKRPIMSSLAHTDIGFMSCLHDKYADMKLFLISLAYESKLHRKSSRHFTLFRKLVKKIFKPLKVDYTSGWDEGYSQVSAIDRVNDLIGDIEAKSQVFGRYNHFALDLVQNMIKLPLRGKKVKDLGVAFIAIDSELAKLDEEIGSSFYNLYMFKKITEIASKLRILYENRAKRKVALKLFKKKIYAELDQISKYCIPSLNFERLLCGLLVYSDAVEGVLYRSCNDVWGKKQKDHEKMQYNSVYEISKYIDSMLPDKIRANKNTVIRVTDANNQKYEEFTVTSSEAKLLNKSKNYDEDLFDIYTKRFSEESKVNGVRPVMFSDVDSIETYQSDDEEVVRDEEDEEDEQEDEEDEQEDNDEEDNDEEDEQKDNDEEDNDEEDEQKDNDEEDQEVVEEDQEVVEEDQEVVEEDQEVVEDEQEVVEDDHEISGSEHEEHEDDEGEAVEEGSGSEQEGSGSEQEGSGSEQEGSGSEKEDDEDAQEGSGSENEGSGSEQEGSGSEQEGSGSEQEGSGSEDEGSGSEDEGSGSEDEGSGSEQGGSGSEKEDDEDAQEGSGSEQEGSGSEDEGSGSENEGSGSENEGSGSENEGSGSENEGSGSEQEGSGSEQEGSGSEDEGSGSEQED